MLDFLQMIVQALLSLILGIFGFSWDMPEDSAEDEVTEVAIVRILPFGKRHDILQPVTLLENSKMALQSRYPSCPNHTTNVQTLEKPEILDAHFEAFSS
jgi:hypothetical protein